MEMDEEKLSGLNRATFKAEDERDVEKMRGLIDDDFWIVRSNGIRRTRSKFLDEVGDSRAGSRNVVEEDIERVSDSCAIVSSVLKFQAPGEPAGFFWNTKLFVKRDGGWRCRAWQVTRQS